MNHGLVITIYHHKDGKIHGNTIVVAFKKGNDNKGLLFK